MTAIPDGYYLVNLRIDGRERLANFEIKNYQARCVNTDYAKLKNLRGAFQWVGNGVFFLSVQNERYHATQHWVFQVDGSAIVKEVPDRGEVQRAIKIKDDSIPTN